MASHFGLSTLVWISVKPVIKIALPGLVGAQLARSGKLGKEGLKAAAQIQILGALPCLLFSNLVPSITTENSKDAGICIALAIFYMGMSYVLARLLLLFAVVPHHFKNGFIVAAVWSNWGNLPFSVIQSLASESPFGQPGDTDLGLAYASFFVLVNNLSLFAGPGTTLIQRDFQSDSNQEHEGRGKPSQFVTSQPSVLSSEHAYDRIALPAENSQSATEGPSPCIVEDGRPNRPSLQPTILQRVSSVVYHIISPVSISMALGVITAIIPTLKHMFIEPVEAGTSYPLAPDGKPIFSVFIDAAAYLGAAAIPLALIVTGASFARMSISSHTWPSLPLRAIFGLSILKLVIMPSIGLSTVYALDHFTSVFAGDRKQLLKMICIYYSCSVTSTNQISLSALAAAEFGEEGNSDLLCAFIVVQYLLYPIAGTTIIATGIRMLF